jgi:hypothetical protein
MPGAVVVRISHSCEWDRSAQSQHGCPTCGFLKSACAADLGARCARPAGMIVNRVVAAALPDLP